MGLAVGSVVTLGLTRWGVRSSWSSGSRSRGLLTQVYLVCKTSSSYTPLTSGFFCMKGMLFAFFFPKGKARQRSSFKVPSVVTKSGPQHFGRPVPCRVPLCLPLTSPLPISLCCSLHQENPTPANSLSLYNSSPWPLPPQHSL